MMQDEQKSINTDEIFFSPTSTERYEDKNFVDTSRPVWNYSILYDDDISTFQQGTNYALYSKFGSKPMKVLGREGYHFTVWAPEKESMQFPK